MNVRASITTWPAMGRFSNALLGGIIVASGLGLLLALRLGWIDILPGSAESIATTNTDKPVAVQTTVELTPEKLAAAELHTTLLQTLSIQATRSVPGTIEYDASKRLPVNAPVACVVVKVLVEPGQQVSANQPLAELSSREVGEARDEVLQREAELVLARHEEERANLVAKNVNELLSLLASKPKLPEVEAAFDNRTLGDFHEKIVGAYSKLLLAELAIGQIAGLETGALSGRLIEERRSAREVAAAQFSAGCDTARFSALQDRDKAKATAERAHRLLAVSQQALANLLGPLADMTPANDRSQLSQLVLLSPLAGRVEERKAVQAARVAVGEPLFTIADTSSVWVAAEIRERDWAALDVVKRGEIVVRVPAFNDEQLVAQVHHVGAQIAANTRSLPLVAELPNRDGRLRPGMFVWIDVPLELPRQSLVMPTAAIMRHENQPFVFVPTGERTFERVNVRLGLETRDRVEIVSGIAAGDTVVDRGAFYLKSELLLEREE